MILISRSIISDFLYIPSYLFDSILFAVYSIEAQPHRKADFDQEKLRAKTLFVQNNENRFQYCGNYFYQQLYVTLYST